MGCFPTEPVVVVLGSGTKNVRFSRIFWEVGSLNTSLMIGSGSKNIYDDFIGPKTLGNERTRISPNKWSKTR